MDMVKDCAIDVDYDELIQQFHQTWDTFPGLARLITSKHMVLAANTIAAQAGFMPGTVCASVGKPENHKGCKLKAMFKTGLAQTDNVLPDRVRGWMPVPGYDDVCVHFAVIIPTDES